MPLRVRCRCGQELVLRYSEWMYVVLGICLLALILNSIVLILLYLRLEGIESRTASRSAPAATDDRVAAGPQETPPAPAAEPPPPPPSEKPPLKPPSQEPPPQETPVVRPAEPAEPAEPAGEDPPVAPVRDAPPPAPPPPETPTVTPEPRDARVVSPVSWLDVAPLLRLLALEGSSERGPASSRAVLGFLLDPDRRIRSRAVDVLLDAPAEGALDTDGPGRVLIEAAAPLLQTSPDGMRLLRRAAVRRSSSPPSAETVARLLDELRPEVEAELNGPRSRALVDHVRGADTTGWDLVLLVDVSRSMKEPLADVQREAAWVLRALPWALRDARVGLVLYRDGVEKVSDLSESPEKELLDILQQGKAEGGGDVPEGLHVAIRAALSLGHIGWREAARKDVIVIGDAPPPYAEIRGLVSVLRLAAAQGGYRLHTLGLNPEEGREDVPFFRDLAAAGGGSSATVERPSELGTEILLTLFPEDAHAAVRELAPQVRKLFSS